MQTLAEKLRYLRSGKDQSLQDVATSVGASRAHIWEVETGKTTNPSVDLIRRIADHFQVSVAWLVGETPRFDPDTERSAALYRAVKGLTPENREIVQSLIDGLMKARNKTP